MRLARLETWGIAVACGVLAVACAAEPAERTGDGQRITGPFTHGNLSVFLIHGGGRATGRPLITLQEAMAQKKVVVHETGQVSELAVENLSDADVYIQSGDIVKGGRQDRMISQDFIVPARSGKVPIASFCVEQGRWSRRGNEAAHAFAASSEQVAGKGLKMAARRAADQGKVWQEVAAAQDKLGKSLGSPVAAPESASSLQLTLENKRVTDGVDAYVRALSARGTAAKDAVGVAFAVNGKLSGADVYASRELFARLWPKLLKAAAVEAIAEQGAAAAKPAAPADVGKWMAEADGARAEEKTLSPRVKLRTKEASANVVFETLDADKKDAVLHKSYVAK